MPEITKTDADGPLFAVPTWAWIGFAALALLVYFSGLTVPLMGPDEPRYAEVAREMLTSGDWLTPTLGGHPWFEKPPLLYWLELAAFNLFGVTEFAARLGPALCGLGTVSALWILGKVEDRSASTGFAGTLAIIAVSSVGLIVFSHAAGFDIVLTFALTAALVSFYASDRSTGPSFNAKTLPLALFYIFVAVAILAKGLVGAIFPFAIIGIYHLLSRRWPSRSFLTSLVWGVPLTVLIAAPWHIWMYRRYGSEFIDVYFIQNHFERFTTNRYLHPQPFYFFFWVLPVMSLPWLPFFLAAIWRVFTQLNARPIVLFAVSWLCVPLLFFTFSGSKLPGYVVPAVPAAVVITSLYVFELVQKSRKWRTAALVIPAATLLLTGILLAFALPSFAERDSVKTLIQSADQKGYAAARILTLHMISYNAEYYAAGRLLRVENGTQLRLEGVQLILDEIDKEGRPVLVLVPVEYVSQLTDFDKVNAEVVGENGETAMVAVRAK